MLSMASKKEELDFIAFVYGQLISRTARIFQVCEQCVKQYLYFLKENKHNMLIFVSFAFATSGNRAYKLSYFLLTCGNNCMLSFNCLVISVLFQSNWYQIDDSCYKIHVEYLSFGLFAARDYQSPRVSVTRTMQKHLCIQSEER